MSERTLQNGNRKYAKEQNELIYSSMDCTIHIIYIYNSAVIYASSHIVIQQY